MKIFIEFNDKVIYFSDTKVIDNIGNIDFKEGILNSAMEYIDNEKYIARHNYNEKNNIKVKKLEFPKRAA